jgi:hypothetical protein
MNPGNSGGPISNGQGNVIGVAAFGVRGSQGLNFGIATESIQGFLDAPAQQCSSASATPTPTKPKGPGAVLISDDFSSESKGVLETGTTTPGVQLGYISGEYRIAITGPQADEEDLSIPGSYSNISLAIDARVTGKTGSLIFGCNIDYEQDTGYVVLVNPAEGNMYLVRRDGPKIFRNLTHGKAAGIRIGDSTNHYELTCNKGAISLAINGTATTLPYVESTYTKGHVLLGFAVDRGSTGEARIDNLVVTQR